MAWAMQEDPTHITSIMSSPVKPSRLELELQRTKYSVRRRLRWDNTVGRSPLAVDGVLEEVAYMESPGTEESTESESLGTDDTVSVDTSVDTDDDYDPDYDDFIPPSHKSYHF